MKRTRMWWMLPVVALIAATAVMGAKRLVSGSPKEDPVVKVYKSPTCGCCAMWVEHLRKAGFKVEANDVETAAARRAIKVKHGVRPEYSSCHTALVDGYVIEGHVPAEAIRRLLKERPKVAGLTVPGMPVGSPGMEVEGRAADPYDILTFDEKGKTSVYERRR